VQIQFVHAHETGILSFFLLIVSPETEKPTSPCSSEADISNSFIPYVVFLRQVHSLFRSEFSTECDQVPLPSSSSAFSFVSLNYLLWCHGRWVGSEIIIFLYHISEDSNNLKPSINIVKITLKIRTFTNAWSRILTHVTRSTNGPTTHSWS